MGTKIEYWYLDWCDGARLDLSDDKTAQAVWSFLSCDGETEHLRAMVAGS